MDCLIDDCTSPEYSHGWCQKHYGRWYRHGDPLAVQVIRGDDLTRFRAKFTVDPVTGCHLWDEAVDRGGYARFWTEGRELPGHIWAWTRKHGPVPEGKQLDHFRCDTERCVNDEHVRPVTSQENILRSTGVGAVNRAKTHCPDDHEYTPENTHVDKTGRRRCRLCMKLQSRAARQRRKAISSGPAALAAGG